MTAQVPPQIGDALFAKSIPAHVCSYIGRTKDELVVEGTKPRYTNYGVFYFRGKRVVAVYVRQAKRLCNTSSSTIGAEWTL